MITAALSKRASGNKPLCTGLEKEDRSVRGVTEAYPRDAGVGPNLAEESVWLVHRRIPDRYHKKFEEGFGTSWAVWHFTRGEYITSSESFPGWLSGKVVPGTPAACSFCKLRMSVGQAASSLLRARCSPVWLT